MRIFDRKSTLALFVAVVCAGIVAFFHSGVFAQDRFPRNAFSEEAPLRLVRAGDADLAVRFRKGEGMPIVFVHGSWDDHHAWMPVAERLAGKVGNPIVLYDRRGHSASTPDTKPGSISQDVADLLRLAEKLGFEKACFIGHSYGANIVAQLTGAHPEKAESIVLYEPPMFGLLKDSPAYKPEMQKMKQVMAAVKTLLENGEIEEGTILFVEEVAFGRNSWRRLFDNRARSAMTANYRTWLDQSNDPERLNVRPEKLNGFNGKITIVSGTHSIPVYPAVAAVLKAKVARAIVKAIPEAGHGGPVSHPEETAGIILEHIELERGRY